MWKAFTLAYKSTIFTYYTRNREAKREKIHFSTFEMKRVQTIKTTTAPAPPPPPLPPSSHVCCRHQNRNQIDCCKNFIKPREHSLYRNSTIQWYIASTHSLSPSFFLFSFSLSLPLLYSLAQALTSRKKGKKVSKKGRKKRNE